MKPVAGALALLLCGLSDAAWAGCNSPHLAPGYCDQDGDLVADPPHDKSQWLDPEVIMVADVTTYDLLQRVDRSGRFVHYLENALKRKVRYFVARDNAEMTDAFKANRIHLVNINSGGVAQAVRCHGFVPLVQITDAGGKLAGYTMELVVPAASPIKSVRQLKGHRITFVDDTSASGYKAPLAILREQFGMLPGRDFRFDFSGRHDSSLMGVAGGIYEAAAIASGAREDLEHSKLLDAAALRVIYTSRPFPLPPWGVSNRLAPALSKRLLQALLDYRGDDAVQGPGNHFRVANYKDDWAPVRAMFGAGEAGTKCQ
ncbi:MAG: phosphate/phosphite/phosphonate ABC transporter substrate-binding protein [Pseudomonadota bacterium]